ncbi:MULTISPECIES: glycosyltransferase [Stenotrophomonas]|uniref:glycosyltransferase n=1 Tax=Stenotrophomonas TaxID=40323 RepID=UPI0025EBD413|nr:MULTISPECIES: glycosyltransferase [Stenotrophomonas]
MRLWLLLSRFESGGLERVQANLAPALAQAGLDVWLVAGQFLADAKGMSPHSIATLEISPKGKHTFIAGLLKHLRSQRPDIVMTTSNDVACLMLIFRAVFFPKIKVICAQHLSISAPWHNARGVQRIKNRLLIGLMRYLWPKADAIIAVSSALAEDIRTTLKLRTTIHTIHNPVVLPDFEEKMQQNILWPWPDHAVATLGFAGRLAKVKRLDLLLDAFLQVVQTHRTRLLIVGDGPERAHVARILEQRGLRAMCHLTGHQDNPLPWIKAVDILILPSDYEGFGNVLVEALACGTQVIATDCPHGPAEILENGKYGQLVPVDDSLALAQAIERTLLKDFYVPAQTLKRRASEFNLERAASAYLRVILEASIKS